MDNEATNTKMIQKSGNVGNYDEYLPGSPRLIDELRSRAGGIGKAASIAMLATLVFVFR